MWNLEAVDDFTGYGYDDLREASHDFERCDNCSCEMGRHEFEVCETCHYKRCLRCSLRNCENCGYGRKDHHNTAEPLEITSVQLYDSHKRAIDFENDEGTKSKLLRAIGGFLAARVKEEVEVKEEPNEAEPNVEVKEEPNQAEPNVEVKEEPNEAEPNVEVREEHIEAEPPEEERRRGRRSQRSRQRFNAMRQRAPSPGSL